MNASACREMCLPLCHQHHEKHRLACKLPDQAQCPRQIADNNAELRQQLNLYEAVRSDRNLYSKNLIAAQDEILDLKRKFKILVQPPCEACHADMQLASCRPELHYQQ